MLGACIALAGLTSCEKYLDVRPKSQIPASLHFDRESGYDDQLIGVYTKMALPELYGRELTFGLMEVLGQNYDLNPNNTYRFATEYDYLNNAVRPRIDEIWNNMYSCIANLNIMLEYIEDTDPAIFRDDNRRLYKGEALGLRAFLHLDLLRIFSPSPAANSGAMAIPYVVEYAPKITPQRTVAQTIDLIIDDLEEAIILMSNDPWHVADINDKFRHRSTRGSRFNYYAVAATLARAYHWKGDNINALRYAEIIIRQALQGTTPHSAFIFQTDDLLNSSADHELSRQFTLEQVFHLNVNQMQDVVNPFFTGEAGNDLLTMSQAKQDEIFEIDLQYGNDYRRLNAFTVLGTGEIGITKFLQTFGGRTARDAGRLPVIRMTEAFYIAAEILKDGGAPLMLPRTVWDTTWVTNSQGLDSMVGRAERDTLYEFGPVRLLNNIRCGPEHVTYMRGGRNLNPFPLPETLTPEQIQQEIFKEYRKEFIAEGQLFFYYKRRNEPVVGAPMPAAFVLPMPDNEVDFGHRQ